MGFDLKAALRDKNGRQLVVLYFSLAGSMVVGIGVSVFNAHVLGVDAYGDLRFLQTVFAVLVTSLTFGYFVTGSRLLAKEEHEGGERRLVGSLLLIAGAIAVLVVTSTLAFSLVEDQIFGNGLDRIVRIVAPLTFALPLQLCVDNILQGTNRIYRLSILRIAPQALYLASALVLNGFYDLSLIDLLLTHLATLGIVVVLMGVWLRPDFRSFGTWFPVIQEENRNYGFHVYIGFLTGVASSHLGVLAVSYYMGSEDVAHFALAVTLSLPLTLLPNAVGTTFFRDFARQDRIAPALEGLTWVLSAVALFGFVGLVGFVVDILYPEDYEATVGLARWIAIGAVLHGLGDFYNRFAGAHGRGRIIRNSNFAVGATNVLGNVVLVALFGVVGAVVTRVLAGFMYVGIMGASYMVMVRRASPPQP
jgi:O-antigen/teichoic acid export membrane protein